MTAPELLRQRAAELEAGAHALADAYHVTGDDDALRASDARAIAALVICELAAALELAGEAA